jgi:lipid A 3-O-deacylase
MSASGWLPLIGDNRFGVDIVPQLGAPIGNIYTYGETGVLLRIGRAGCRLRTRQNTPRVVWNGLFRRGGSRRRAGLLFFSPAHKGGRVVGRNIFLGGNSFRTSPSVSKKNLVGDAQAGFSVLWSKSLRLDISVALRTEEFHGQRTPDDICTAALSFTW